jgi:hypothetical protein
VFREDEDMAELVQKGSREQAVADDVPGRNTATTPDADSNAAKRKNWLFGKKA